MSDNTQKKDILKVNHLPVLTWYRDKLNDVEMEVSEATIEAIAKASHPAYLVKPQFPAEMKVTEGVSPAELLKGYEAEGMEIKREEYVAGKYPMYQEQVFPTGMGADIDRLIVKTGVPARVMELPANVKIKDPVYLHYTYPTGAEDIDTTLIRIGEGSEITIIQYMDSEHGATNGFAGTQTRVVLGKNAKLHLIKVQCLPGKFVYFNDMGCRMDDSSEFTYTELSLGAGDSYLGTYIDQIGKESKFRADLGFVSTEGSMMDLNYTDVFRGVKSEGVMRFNGVMLEGSYKASRETLDFRKGAIGAVGDEEENVLLLGKSVVNKTIPMILGEEEKVNGRHAASSGRISDEMLFYMETRGIDECAAREMMIRSNISRVSRLIPNGEIRAAAEAYVDRIFSECDGNCVTCPGGRH